MNKLEEKGEKVVRADQINLVGGLDRYAAGDKRESNNQGSTTGTDHV